MGGVYLWFAHMSVHAHVSACRDQNRMLMSSSIVLCVIALKQSLSGSDGLLGHTGLPASPGKPPVSQCWGYRHMQPCLASLTWVLWFNLMSLCFQSKALAPPEKASLQAQCRDLKSSCVSLPLRLYCMNMFWPNPWIGVEPLHLS